MDVFADVNDLIRNVKSIVVRAPALKRGRQAFLLSHDKPVKLPPESVLNLWNSWFEAMRYHEV